MTATPAAAHNRNFWELDIFSEFCTLTHPLGFAKDIKWIICANDFLIWESQNKTKLYRVAKSNGCKIPDSGPGRWQANCGFIQKLESIVFFQNISIIWHSFQWGWCRARGEHQEPSRRWSRWYWSPTMIHNVVKMILISDHLQLYRVGFVTGPP